jgi:hypothetical protein
VEVINSTGNKNYSKFTNFSLSPPEWLEAGELCAPCGLSSSGMGGGGPVLLLGWGIVVRRGFPGLYCTCNNIIVTYKWVPLATT